MNTFYHQSDAFYHQFDVFLSNASIKYGSIGKMLPNQIECESFELKFSSNQNFEKSYVNCLIGTAVQHSHVCMSSLLCRYIMSKISLNCILIRI